MGGLPSQLCTPVGAVPSATNHSLAWDGLSGLHLMEHCPLRNTDTNPQSPWDELVASQGWSQTSSSLGKALPKAQARCQPSRATLTGLAGGRMGTQAPWLAGSSPLSTHTGSICFPLQTRAGLHIPCLLHGLNKERQGNTHIPSHA